LHWRGDGYEPVRVAGNEDLRAAGNEGENGDLRAVGDEDLQYDEDLCDDVCRDAHQEYGVHRHDTHNYYRGVDNKRDGDVRDDVCRDAHHQHDGDHYSHDAESYDDHY